MANKSESTPDSKSPQSVYQEVVDLQAVLEAKRQSAIADLLGQRAEIDQHLAALGYDGTAPAPKPSASSVAIAKPAGKKTAAERYCAYCDDFGHDGRAHRFQKKKKRFTQAEREALAS